MLIPDLSYDESIDLLYSVHTFVFRDPYALIYFATSVPSYRLHSIHYVYVRWELQAESLATAHAAQQATWLDFWQAVELFDSLRILKVNISYWKPVSSGLWTLNLDWLEPVKAIVTPIDFELLLPIDVEELEIDMSPASCRVVGHPFLSAPEHINPDHMAEYRAFQAMNS